MVAIGLAVAPDLAGCMRSRFRGDIRRRRSRFRRAGTCLAEHKDWPGPKARWRSRRARNRGCCQIRRLPGWNCPALCWAAYSGWLRPDRPQGRTGRPRRCCHIRPMRWKRWECKTRCPPSVYLHSDYRLHLPASWQAGPIGCNSQERQGLHGVAIASCACGRCCSAAGCGTGRRRIPIRACAVTRRGCRRRRSAAAWIVAIYTGSVTRGGCRCCCSTAGRRTSGRRIPIDASAVTIVA